MKKLLIISVISSSLILSGSTIGWWGAGTFYSPTEIDQGENYTFQFNLHNLGSKIEISNAKLNFEWNDTMYYFPEAGYVRVLETSEDSMITWHNVSIPENLPENDTRFEAYVTIEAGPYISEDVIDPFNDPNLASQFYSTEYTAYIDVNPVNTSGSTNGTANVSDENDFQPTNTTQTNETESPAINEDSFLTKNLIIIVVASIVIIAILAAFIMKRKS